MDLLVVVMAFSAMLMVIGNSLSTSSPRAPRKGARRSPSERLDSAIVEYLHSKRVFDQQNVANAEIEVKNYLDKVSER